MRILIFFLLCFRTQASLFEHHEPREELLVQCAIAVNSFVALGVPVGLASYVFYRGLVDLFEILSAASVLQPTQSEVH